MVAGLIISDSLPLRLIDRQFIDLRGNYESGLSDLLSVLESHLGPFKKSPEFVDDLIAKAIRARLVHDYRESNALVEQFEVLDCEIASSGYSFWRKIESSLDTNFAESIPAHLKIKEFTRLLDDDLYGDDEAYEWTLEVHGEDSHLNLIDYVTYELHPTFRDRIQ